MDHSESLKSNQDFQKVYKNGKSYANKYLVMYVVENGTSINRLGISVSKKVGNSVVRHHMCRLIRESYRFPCYTLDITHPPRWSSEEQRGDFVCCLVIIFLINLDLC